jgi:hypothetical protein
MRHVLAALTCLMIGLLAGVPATAQEITRPRYEALEQQLQTLEQRELDTLERRRLEDLLRPPAPSGADPAASAAARALRQLEFQRQQDELIVRGQQDRALAQRERTIAEQALPNRRISPSSILVVREPAAFGLPEAPAGKFYARLDGRFVLIDAASEMVERILPVQPTDPTADVPQAPRPPLSPPVAVPGPDVGTP